MLRNEDSLRIETDEELHQTILRTADYNDQKVKLRVTSVAKFYYSR